MLYRKLLVPLSETPCGQAALATGLALAKNWQAHLAALIVQVNSRDVAPLAGEGLSGAMIEDMMAASERDSAIRARALTQEFAAAAAAAGVAVAEFAENQATASIFTVTGHEEEVISAQARLADLTVLPHGDRGQDSESGEALHAVLFDSGRPVLIAPKQAPARVGTRCCLAWNGTAESSAALWAMLPWLKTARAVRVLHANAYQRRGPVAADVLGYLKLHGVVADVAEFAARERDVGAGMLAAAADFGADLLGMGAYSHSRLRQLILGGVTRHVLENSPVAVLMCR